MKLILAITGTILALQMQAGVQDQPPTTSRNYVYQDPGIEWLLNAHKQLSRTEKGMPGFRVQIFMDSGNQARLRTQRARAEFERKHPGIKIYITYNEPYFRLRVGDFRTRLDARRFMEKISHEYPAGSVFIVVDTINFPEFEEELSNQP